MLALSMTMLSPSISKYLDKSLQALFNFTIMSEGVIFLAQVPLCMIMDFLAMSRYRLTVRISRVLIMAWRITSLAF